MAFSTKDFARMEVVELVQRVSSLLHTETMDDCLTALSVLAAFCVDMQRYREEAKLELFAKIEWALERARETGTRDMILGE